VDTTSSALSRIVELLAEHQDVQDRLRDELTIARDTGKQVDYDYLHNLPYLEAILRETLRLYVTLARTLVLQAFNCRLHVDILQFRFCAEREGSFILFSYSHRQSS